MRNDKGIMETSLTFIQAALIFIPVALATIAIIYIFFGGLGTARDEMTLGVAWRCEKEVTNNIKFPLFKPYHYTWSEKTIKEVERLRLDVESGTKCSGLFQLLNDVSTTRGVSAYACADNGLVLYQHGFGNEELAQDDDSCDASSASIYKNRVAAGYNCASGTRDKVKVFDIDAVLATPIASLDVPTCTVTDVSLYGDRIAVGCKNGDDGEARLYEIDTSSRTLNLLDRVPFTCSISSVSLYGDLLAVGEFCFTGADAHWAQDSVYLYHIETDAASTDIITPSFTSIRGLDVCQVVWGGASDNDYGPFIFDVALEGDLLAAAWYCADVNRPIGGDWEISYLNGAPIWNLKAGPDVEVYRLEEDTLEIIPEAKGVVKSDTCMARSVSLHSPLDDIDSDKDGLSDLYEKTITKTAPGIADTDGDGYEDGEDPYPRDETRPGFDWEAVETWMVATADTSTRRTTARPTIEYGFNIMFRNSGDIDSPAGSGTMELIRDSSGEVVASHEYVNIPPLQPNTDTQYGVQPLYTFTESGTYTVKFCFEERTALPLDTDPSNNCAESTITAGGSVDLNMIDVWTTGLYQVGQPNSVTLRLRVRNDGPESSGPTTATFTVYNKNADGNRGGEADTISRGINPLDPNNVQDKYVSWTPTAIGNYELEACVPGVGGEMGSGNNCNSEDFTVGSDLEVIDLWATNTPGGLVGQLQFTAGQTAHFRSIVKNNGPGTSPMTRINYWVFPTNGAGVRTGESAVYMNSELIGNIDNGGTEGATISWTAETGFYEVEACTLGSTSELNTANDCETIWIAVS